MANIHGTNHSDKILPGSVSAGVTGGVPGDGPDTIRARGGNDFVSGGLGDDHANLGAGADRYVWSIGEGNDTINGGGGVDTLVINQASSSGAILVLGHIAGTALVANFDLSQEAASTQVERLVFRMSAGNDGVVVQGMAGTSVTAVTVDLAAPGSKLADGVTDGVFVEGTNARDLISVIATSGGVKVRGLHAETTILHADGGVAGDQLAVKGLGGNDRIDASGMTAKALALLLGGGKGNDTLIGGAGRDSLDGGSGSDVLIGGKGRDFLDGADGFDRLTGGAGADQFAFQSKLVNNVDTIVDFQVGIDKIALGDVFFPLDGNTVSADQFHVGSAAADGNDHIIYNPKTGALFYDADGDGSGAAIRFAALTKHLALTDSDFVVLP